MLLTSPRRSSRLALAVVAALATMLAACGTTASDPRPVALADLAAEQERYDGDLVIAEGTVRSYDEPLHYWIEDAELNRVELEPQDQVEELVSHDIRVTGTFTYDPEQGRLITIDDLEVVREPPEA